MARSSKHFRANESGNAALEYAILAATVSVMLIVGIDGLGMRLAATLAKSASLALGAVYSP